MKITPNQRYGFWKTLERDSLITATGRTRRGWKCLCTACNVTIRLIDGFDLRVGKTRSCGCQQKRLTAQTWQNYRDTGYVQTIIKKRTESMLTTHGVAFPGQLEASKVAAKKRRSLEKGQVFHSWQVEKYDTKGSWLCKCLGCGTLQSIKSSDLKEGKTKSCGCLRTHYTQKTNVDKYGVESPTQLPENRYKLREWCEENPEKLNPSTPELEILVFIRQYYPSAHKMRKGGHELDVFIPELNLGIEHNGLYYHCIPGLMRDDRKTYIEAKNYHLTKTNYFKSKDIRVIHIWGHEWLSRKRQVKSFLLSAINKNEIKIGARKCRFVWSNDKEEIKKAQHLLEATHIQGRAQAVRFAINAYYNNELVATATFGLHHRNSKQYILSRFTTKTNYTIQGCLSKISKLAYENLRIPIISWADYRLSLGNGYEKAGWKYEELLRPDYFYFAGGNKIISKQSRQKKIVGTPKSMTEREHAELDGLVRIYDCGKIRYKYK